MIRRLGPPAHRAEVNLWYRFAAAFRTPASVPNPSAPLGVPFFLLLFNSPAECRLQNRNERPITVARKVHAD